MYMHVHAQAHVHVHVQAHVHVEVNETNSIMFDDARHTLSL